VASYNQASKRLAHGIHQHYMFRHRSSFMHFLTSFFSTSCLSTPSKERNAFSAQNQTLRSYGVYISPTK